MLCHFAIEYGSQCMGTSPDEKKVTLDLKMCRWKHFLNTVKQTAGINMLYNSQMYLKEFEP